MLATSQDAGELKIERDASACMRRHQAFALAPVQVNSRYVMLATSHDAGERKKGEFKKEADDVKPF